MLSGIAEALFLVQAKFVFFSLFFLYFGPFSSNQNPEYQTFTSIFTVIHTNILHGGCGESF